MIWETVSDYAVKSGDWTIARYEIKNGSVFGLWFKNENRGYFEKQEKAKEFADDKKEKTS